ncbi:Cationic amino acid transporter 5 [Ananas comosus]|uniref:Cationic amino acid transporter 5 n=1 Tax=Ananas comosus TaxID=4615 RepID=A0A199W5B0_ANACO|nr:Cationic amino acid transporter 5 [Ananas comosus]
MDDYAAAAASSSGSGGAGGGGEGRRRSYWRWSKADLFPEPSFRSWGAYGAAVSATAPRLRERLLHRSTSAEELVVLRRESEHPLRRCLSWLDLALLGFGSVVGSGIFVLTGLEAREAAGPAIPLSYAAAGLSALLSSFCYAEFAAEVPSAGGSFSYLRIELGESVAFLAAANILLEALVGAAGLARSWTSYFAALIGRDPDSLRIHAPALAAGFDRLDPIAVVVLAATSSLAAAGARLTSSLNAAASVLGLAVIGFVLAAGFARADPANLSPFLPFGAQGVFRAAAVVFWSYTGFDMVATMAEETRDPARDIPLGLVASMSAITAVYCAMSLALVMLQRYDRLDPDAAYAVAFASVGMGWARTRTPVHATILVTACSAGVAFFSSLDVLASVSSISTLFIFMLLALALLVRRYYVRDATPAPALRKLSLLLALIVGSSVALSAYWNSSHSDRWAGYAVLVPLWLASTLALAVLVPQQRAPKVWGVPLVPWLPSLSIAMNLFLMGSLGYAAYIRFAICTAVMVVYYGLFALHATYDMAHQVDKFAESKDDEGVGDGDPDVLPRN